MVESRINLTVEFAPTFDTPPWSAKEIGERVAAFLSVELETVVKAKVQSAFMDPYPTEGRVIEVTPSPILIQVLREQGIG